MAKRSAPSVIVLAGPNGAGKTTAAPYMLKGSLRVNEFVNSDTIAQGLSGFAPERAALTAGKIMLLRLRELARQRVSFAFETTLASRSFAPWFRSLIRDGYQLRVLFLWLPAEELAIRRVASRVRFGGHGLPEETIRRRYHRSLHNFLHLYRPLAATWRIYDNSVAGRPKLVASGSGRRTTRILAPGLWNRVQGKLGT